MSNRFFRMGVLTLILVFVLGNGLSTLFAQDDTPLIAVLLPDSASSARWENDDRRFLTEAFEEAGVDFSIENAEGDPQTQISLAEQAITNGADVLMFVNLDSGSGAAIIQLARDAGIPVIDYDRLTIEGPGADYYVSFNNEAVGQLQGEGLVAAVEAQYGEDLSMGDLGEDGLLDVAVLNGSPTDNNATLFKNGYDSVINPFFEDEESGWNEVDDQSVPNWDNQEALVIYEQILTAEGGDVDATIAANDGLAQAVITARQAQGLDPIPLTGQDATVGGIQQILAGWQSMTVYKAIRQQAGAAAELAIALANGDQEAADELAADVSTYESGGETVEVASVLLVPVSVTIDNIAETVIEDGFRTWEEICVGEFEEFCPEDAMMDMDDDMGEMEETEEAMEDEDMEDDEEEESGD